jgi:hypothetical protein
VKGILTMFINTDQLDLKRRQASQALYDLFEAANWGIPTPVISQTAESASSQSSSSSSANRSKVTTSSSSKITTALYRKAPHAHPIYGEMVLCIIYLFERNPLHHMHSTMIMLERTSEHLVTTALLSVLAGLYKLQL